MGGQGDNNQGGGLLDRAFEGLEEYIDDIAQEWPLILNINL